MGQPLNVIGQRYDADAVMLGKAFDFASNGPARDFWERVADYVDSTARDRRYKVKVRAASVGGSGIDSAIIEYRGRRLYVWGRWDSISKTRTYYVELSHNN